MSIDVLDDADGVRRFLCDISGVFFGPELNKQIWPLVEDDRSFYERFFKHLGRQFPKKDLRQLSDDQICQVIAAFEQVSRGEPWLMAPEELALVVKDVIAETKSHGVKDLGKVMKAALARVAGRANGKDVQAAVKAALADG